MVFHINDVFSDRKSILVYRMLAHPPRRASLLRFIWIVAHILRETLYTVGTESSTPTVSRDEPTAVSLPCWSECVYIFMLLLNRDDFLWRANVTGLHL